MRRGGSIESHPIPHEARSQFQDNGLVTISLRISRQPDLQVGPIRFVLTMPPTCHAVIPSVRTSDRPEVSRCTSMRLLPKHASFSKPCSLLRRRVLRSPTPTAPAWLPRHAT